MIIVQVQLLQVAEPLVDYILTIHCGYVMFEGSVFICCQDKNCESVEQANVEYSAV